MQENAALPNARAALTPRVVAVFLGMTLYWPLLRRTAMFYSVGGHDQNPWQTFGWYGLFLVLAVLCVAAVLVLGRARKGIRVSDAALAALFVVQATCKIVETCIPLPSGLAGVVAFVDVATYAAVFVALALLWYRACVFLDPRTMALVATASFAASFAFVDALLLLEPPLHNIVLACLPAVSAICWYAGRHGEAPQVPTAQPALAERPLAPTALLVVVGVFMVAGGVIRGLVYTELVGGPFQGNPLQNMGTILFAALIFLYCALGGGRRRSFQLLWSLAAVLFFAGLLLMAFMDNSQFNIGGNIVIMGRTCLGLIYWILLCDMARMRRDVPDVMFVGIFVLVEVLSSFLGYIAVPLAMSSLGLSLQNQSGPLVGAVAFLLIITAILFFNRPQADALSGRGGASRRVVRGSATPTTALTLPRPRARPPSPPTVPSADVPFTTPAISPSARPRWRSSSPRATARSASPRICRSPSVPCSPTSRTSTASSTSTRARSSSTSSTAVGKMSFRMSGRPSSAPACAAADPRLTSSH